MIIALAAAFSLARRRFISRSTGPSAGAAYAASVRGRSACLIRRHVTLSPPNLESTLTCPHCGFAVAKIMPTDACLYFYECTRCRTLLRPKPGDCCVFCSYGSVKCPPIQQSGCGCIGADHEH